MSAARGRGAILKGTKPVNNKGPATRSNTLAMSQANEFTTPSTFDQNENTDDGYHKQVNDFVQSNIADHTERSRMGLELVNKSPDASQSEGIGEQPIINNNSVNRQEVEEIIAASIRHQIELMTERFSSMMVNYMNEIRAHSAAEHVRRPEAQNLPNRGFANSSEPNDSYQNLFSRPQPPNVNGPDVPHGNNRSNYTYKKRRLF